MADRAAALARSTLKKQLRLGKRTLQQLITDTENTRNKITVLNDERRAINAQIIELKARRVAEEVDESIETQIYERFRRRDEIDQELAPLRKSIGQLISMLNAWNTFFKVLPNDQEKPDNWDSILENLKKQEQEEGPEPEASSEGLSSFEGSSVLEEEGNLSDLLELDDAEAEPYERGSAFVFMRRVAKRNPKRQTAVQLQREGEERESDELKDASWSYSDESLPRSGSGSGSGSGGGEEEEEEEEESGSQSGSESMSPGGTPPGTPPPPRKRWQEGQAGTAVEPPPAMIPVPVEPAPATESSRLTQMLNQPHVKSVFVQAFLEAQKAGRKAIQPKIDAATEAKEKRRLQALVPSQMDAVKRLGTVTLNWDNARDYGRNKPYVGSTILEWLLRDIRGEESRDAKRAFYSYLVNFLFTQLTYAEYVLTNYLGGFDNLVGRIGNDKAKETYAWLVNTWFVDNPQEVPSVTDVQGGLGYLVQGFPETREPISRKKKTPLSSPVRQPPLPVRIVPEREESVVILPTPARVLPALSTSISAFFPSPEEYETNKKPGMPASSYEQQLQIVRTWLDAIQTKSGLQSDEELLANFRQFFEGYYDDEDFDKYSRLTAERLFYTIFFYAKPETIGTREFNDYVLREDIFLGFVEDYEEYSLIRAFLAQFEKKPKLVVPPPAPSAGKGKEELSEEAPPPPIRVAPAGPPKSPIRASPAGQQAEAIATPLTELLSQPHNRELLETAFNMARDAALPTDLAQQKKVAKSLPTNLDAALQKFEPFTKAKSTYTISAVVGYLTQSFKSPNKEANVAFWKALLGFIYNQLMPTFKFINARFVNFDGWKTKLQSFPSGETLAMATYHWLVWEWFVSHAPSDEPTAQDFARAFQSEQQIWSQVFGVRVVSEASLSSSESRRVPTKQRRTVPEEPAMIPVLVPEPAAAAPQVPNKWEQFLGRFNATEEQVRRMLLWTFEGDETTANRLFDFIRNKAATAADPLTLELDDRIMKVLVNASQVDQFEKREQEELERQRKVPKTKFDRFLERYGTTVRKLWAYLREYGNADELKNRKAMNDLLKWLKRQPDVETAVPSDDWVAALKASSQIELVEQLVEAALPLFLGCNACGKAKPKTQSSCCNGKMRYCGQACADRHWNAGHRKCCTGPGRKQ